MTAVQWYGQTDQLVMESPIPDLISCKGRMSFSKFLRMPDADQSERESERESGGAGRVGRSRKETTSNGYRLM